MKKRNWVAATLIAGALAGCGLWGEKLSSTELRALPITEVEAPETVKLGTEVKLKVTGRLNGCEEFEDMWIDVREPVRIISVGGFLTEKFYYPPRVCPGAENTVTRVLTFTPQSVGEYRLLGIDRQAPTAAFLTVVQ